MNNIIYYGWLARLKSVLCIAMLGYGSFVYAQETYHVEDTEMSGQPWTEVRMEGRGVVVRNAEGAQIVMIDRFGGVYIYGDLFINNKHFDTVAFDNVAKVDNLSKTLTRVTILNVALAIFISVAISSYRRRRDRQC